MTEDKETTAEVEVHKAMAGLRATIQKQAAELDALKGKMVEEKARIAFTEAMQKADARPQAKEFGLKLLLSEVRNVRLTDDGDLVGSLGDLEAATPEELVKSFVAQNEFLQKVVTADGLDVSAIVAKPLDTSALQHADSLGNPIALGDLSADEIFDAAGLPPREHFSGGGEPPDWFRYTAAPPKPKASPVKPLTDVDREALSSDEMFELAGEAPGQR